MLQPRFSKRALVAVLIFLAVAALVLWRGFLVTGRRTVRLADGRELTIRQVTYGTQHKFVTGTPWARLLNPILPASMKATATAQTLVQKTEAPSMVIWGEWRLGKADSPAATLRLKGRATAAGLGVARSWTFGNSPAQQLRKRLAGGPVPGVGGTSMSLRNGSLFMAWILTNFPRRESHVDFEICEWERFQNGFTSASRLKPVAEFSLPNPIARKFPEWKADPYPIVKPANGLQFSMVNFSTGPFIAAPWMTIMAHLQLATGYVATFSVARNGHRLSNWQIDRLIVSDATGNAVKSKLEPSVLVGDFLVYGLDETLWPSEKAWQFETHFTRRSGFASNELCTMSAIEVPPFSTSPTQMLVSAQANGVAFIGVEIQRMRPPPSMQRMREDLEIEPLLPQTFTNRLVSLAKVRDDQGRELIHDRSYFNLDGMHFGIQLLPDSRALDLTFAVQEPVVVGFVGGISDDSIAKR